MAQDYDNIGKKYGRPTPKTFRDSYLTRMMLKCWLIWAPSSRLSSGQSIIPEELMRESKGYQLMLKENTIEHIIALLEQQFHTETARALMPMLQNIDDLERLKELHLAAARVPNIEAFTQELIGE